MCLLQNLLVHSGGDRLRGSIPNSLRHHLFRMLVGTCWLLLSTFSGWPSRPSGIHLRAPLHWNRSGNCGLVSRVLCFNIRVQRCELKFAISAPNATFAALVNPVVISVLVLFNGAFVPYSQMQVFWKYWLCKRRGCFPGP